MYRFPLPPSANKYWRYYRGRVVASAEAVNYKTTVRMLARCDGVTPLSGPVAVRVAVHRERRAGDLDNFLKILIDALQGVFYENDAQIREIHATLQEDRHEPRVEVQVTSCRSYA
jgi:Holliday junction resolvase RusA-like endonuclease